MNSKFSGFLLVATLVMCGMFLVSILTGGLGDSAVAGQAIKRGSSFGVSLPSVSSVSDSGSSKSTLNSGTGIRNRLVGNSESNLLKKNLIESLEGCSDNENKYAELKDVYLDMGVVTYTDKDGQEITYEDVCYENNDYISSYEYTCDGNEYALEITKPIGLRCNGGVLYDNGAQDLDIYQLDFVGIQPAYGGKQVLTVNAYIVNGKFSNARLLEDLNYIYRISGDLDGEELSYEFTGDSISITGSDGPGTLAASSSLLDFAPNSNHIVTFYLELSTEAEELIENGNDVSAYVSLGPSLVGTPSEGGEFYVIGPITQSSNGMSSTFSLR